VSDGVLPVVVAGIIVASLNFYVVLGGADFGGGVWDLLATGPRRRAQRGLIADAIGPIWEANHVWLIVAVVLVFACFPTAFARLSVALHVPLTLMLVGVVLRGSAFTFRAYDSHRDAVQRRWGRIFAIASTITPVLLGMCVGAVASGRVGEATRGDFAARYLAPWTDPFAVTIGVLTLALFAFLAAVFLTIEATDAALRDDFRRRALAAAAVVFAAAATGLVLAPDRLAAGLLTGGGHMALQVVTGVAAVAAVAALWRRRWRAARAAAVTQASLIVWSWAFAQLPLIVPPDLTLEAAAAPPITLKLTVVGMAGGAVVLVPSLWYLFHVFKAPPRDAAPR
jgi:cytochrome d ubiquinol oxidase subunit II